jgi:4-amino-4-deoxy-L-arabinose transferase-like glycosyltransferase
MRSLLNPEADSETKARRAFWFFLPAHVFLWTILPVLFHPNAPLDVVEEISWGREWQLGYYKHPPLASWLANIAYLASGGRLWSIFLLSQLVIAVGFCAVWLLAREAAGVVSALASVVLLEGIIYYNLTSIEFNPNVLELALWPLIVLYAWRVLPRGESTTASARGEARNWILLGVFAGLGLWAKYYTGILLFSLLGFFVADRTARKKFTTAGPYVAAIVAFAVFLPHLLWMSKHGFETIRYAAERAETKHTLLTHIIFPVRFAGSQVLAMALMLIGFVALYGFRVPKLQQFRDSRRRLLAVAVFGPLTITLTISAALNWKLLSMWGVPLWSFLPLALIAGTGQRRQQVTLRKVATVGIALTSIAAAAFIIGLAAEPYIYKMPRKALFPGDEMARTVTEGWRARMATPLRFVVGDTWLAGNVAFYSPDRPATLTDANPALSPWVNLAEMSDEGAILVWDGSRMPAAYAAQFPQAEEQPPLSLHWHTRVKVANAVIHWAIVPSAGKRDPGGN